MEAQLSVAHTVRLEYAHEDRRCSAPRAGFDTVPQHFVSQHALDA